MVITAPADYRLVRKPSQIVNGVVEVHAAVLSARTIKQVTCKTEAGQRVPMAMGADGRTWHATINLPVKDSITITVEAVDEKGWAGSDTVCISEHLSAKVEETADGSDTASIGAWQENGIFGTQLGPNRNAKPFHK